jgi:hypothetical protein
MSIINGSRFVHFGKIADIRVRYNVTSSNVRPKGAPKEAQALIAVSVAKSGESKTRDSPDWFGSQLPARIINP